MGSLGARFDIRLFCGVFLMARNEMFDLSPGVLNALSVRGLKLVFDVYAPDESDLDGLIISEHPNDRSDDKERTYQENPKKDCDVAVPTRDLHRSQRFRHRKVKKVG